MLWMTCNKSISSEIEYKSLYMLHTPNVITDLYVEARKGGVKTVRKMMTFSPGWLEPPKKFSKSKTFYSFSQALTNAWASKTAFSKEGDNSTQGKQQLKQASLSTQVRYRTQGRLADCLQIQEISWTWYIAIFKFEYNYRVASAPSYQSVNSRIESHQSETRLGGGAGEAPFCLSLSDKDCKRLTMRVQVVVHSHIQSLSWTEKCFQLPSSPRFSENRYWESPPSK